ncbi:hypothetical protein SLUN_10970 [Streptomyces lunaelactis]|uniref:Secreted protein n=1 Tax=Streptomyces lunaelactis TaxID=1535768 RepID=A0A2R4T0I4_9ACTN|nr:hypothetical protein [Streptomyces lunaelactis]AVZ72636.1 hypothetical protein SLUN_10970 [Streptomyces lunaelactis]NUK90046.1 hypothetical protein [Streptomyces lunaelactis]NUL07912.1 hypothetical protein [Streptomyces lunaelactis]
MFRRFVAVVAAAGAVALSAAPASASPTHNWQPVKTNSNWECSAYGQHSAYAGVWGGVRFKTCTVMGNTWDTKAQGVLVVQNLANQDIYIEKGRIVFESNMGGDVWCAASNLAAGATAGCFAPSISPLNCQLTTGVDTELTILGRTDTDWVRGREVPC